MRSNERKRQPLRRGGWDNVNVRRRVRGSLGPNTSQRWQFRGSNCAKARHVQGEKSSNEAEPQEKQWVAFSNVRRSCDSENEKEKKTVRDVEDGVLLIIPIRIFGKGFHALVDSGFSRSFISPSAVDRAQLQCKPCDTFLELGNGEKILSRGLVPSVPIVTGGICTKMNLTVTKLLFDVDVVLGVNWLKIVNPLIDWANATMYILHRITETGVIRGDWIGPHQKVGTVTVLRDDRELEALKSPEIQRSVQVLRRPSFWDYAFSSKTSLWTSSSLKGEGNNANSSPKCTVDLKLDEDDQIKVSIIQGLKPVRHDCVKRERNEKEFNAGAKRAKYIHSVKRVQNKPVHQIKSQIAAHRQLMSARGLKKLVKKENVTVFLAIVRKVGEGRRRVAKASVAAINSRSSSAEKKMKASGPKKDSISVWEREEQILSEIEPELREKLRGIVEEFRDVFPEKVAKGSSPGKGMLSMRSKLTLRLNPQIGHLTN